MASSVPSSFLDQPLSPPPPGVISNFAHPQSRASAVYIAAGVCLPLTLIFASLRVYAKATIMKRMRWDDVTCIFGFLAGVSFIVIVVTTVGQGAYGLHQWDITVADFTKKQLLLTLINESIYGPCIWSIKLALFVLYLEVFGLLQWLRYLVFTGALVTGAFYIASFVSFIVLCGPTDGQSQLSYLSALASPRCTGARPLIVTIAVVNVISDFYLILIPLPAVWSLQLPLRRKIGLSAMFLTGLIACIASILGLVYRVQEVRTTDNTWAVINVWVTTIVEMTAGIIIFCMPTTAAAVKKLKSPLSSFLKTCGNGLRFSSRSSVTKHHEQVSSSANLRPTYGGQSHQGNCEIVGGVQKTCSDPESEWQPEYETASAFPLQNSKIRKTTDINVTQSSQKH